MDFTIISCHFGDPWWIKHTIIENNLLLYPEIRKIYVVDNSGNLNVPSITDLGIAEVKTFITDFKASKMHSAALNFSRNFSINTSHVIILDSDLVSLDTNLLPSILDLLAEFDAIVAMSEGSKCLTHPCFLVLSTDDFINLDFTAGQFEFGFDTGRLIGYQLISRGRKVKKLYASKSDFFNIGYFYRELSIFHVTSSTLLQSKSRSMKFVKYLKFKLRKSVAVNARSMENRNFLLVYCQIIWHTLFNKFE